MDLPSSFVANKSFVIITMREVSLRGAKIPSLTAMGEKFTTAIILDPFALFLRFRRFLLRNVGPVRRSSIDKMRECAVAAFSTLVALSTRTK